MTSTAYIRSADVRKDFSSTIDNAVYIRPQFIRRTRNHVVMLGEQMLNQILSHTILPVSIYEENGEYLAVNDVIEDLIGYGSTVDEATDSFCRALMEYAEEYYEEFELYSHSPNRKEHLPYVFRVLSSPSESAVKEMLQCQIGKK